MKTPIDSGLPDRFWNRIDQEGPIPEHRPELGPCWMWTGTTDSNGYGVIRMKGSKYKNHLVHRLMQFVIGKEVGKGIVVDHKCHNPSCVNPEHLRSVTQAQNIQNLRGAYSRSKTGVRGVVQRASGRFAANACVNGKSTYLGLFDTVELAESAVIDWRRENMPNSLMDQELEVT